MHTQHFAASHHGGPYLIPGICGGHSGNGLGFSLSTSTHPVYMIILSTIHVSEILKTWYQVCVSS